MKKVMAGHRKKKRHPEKSPRFSDFLNSWIVQFKSCEKASNFYEIDLVWIGILSILYTPINDSLPNQ